jgi:hypothetical protein
MAELKKYFDYLIKEADVAEKGERKVKQPDQKMIFSDRFKKVLTDIQNIKQSNVSKRLLELEKSSQLFDISYIDVEEDGENISFLQSSRIERLKKENKPIDEFWTTKMRVKQKIGRFIKFVLPKFSDDAIQKFAKKYKAVLKESEEAENFELVDGDQIVYWYDARNYESDYGSMGASCMSGGDCGRFLSIYRNNPNQCKMLILKSADGEKIKGRALVWKLSEPKDVIFMDRIYTNSDDDEMLFTNYAKKEGWYYKNEQKYGGTHIIIPGKGSEEIDMSVILENINFDFYPYVDTLRYFYPDTKTMSTDEDLEGKKYTLTDTEGHYEEYRYENGEFNDPMVWDGYNQEEIPESRATWCRYDNAYCATEDAIRLPYNNEFAFPQSPNIIYSEYTKKWYAKEDCVFSKTLNSWLWKKYAVEVYHDRDKRQSDTTHRFELNKTIGKVGEDYYDIDLLVPLETKKVPGKVAGKVKTEVTYGFKEDQQAPEVSA